MNKPTDKVNWGERVELARTHPWLWLRDLVCTWDPHDPTTTMKPFPNKACYRLITRVWHECNMVFCEKSRQIMMTWTISSLDLWDAVTQTGRLVFFQSKKQEDANDVLDRAKHVYICAHEFEIPWLSEAEKTGSHFGTSTSLYFPTLKSELRAIPQGGDIVRMHTTSRILADEMNHQVEFQSGFEAAKPTIDGGGKYFAQGTANGHTFGWMQLYGIDSRTLDSLGPNKIDSALVKNLPFRPPEHLTLEARRRWIEAKLLTLSEEEFASYPLHELIACMPGMRLWQTAGDVTSLRVHYSADPDKSLDTEIGRAWYERSRKATSVNGWEREMEIRYDTFDGRPVIPEFTRALYVRHDEYNADQILYGSIDFGQSCGCLFFQAGNIPKFNVRRIRFIDEIFFENSNTVELAEAIEEKLNGRFFSSWRDNSVRFYADVAGRQGRETSSDKNLKSSINIMASHNIYCSSKFLGVADSVIFVQSVFARILPDGRPAVTVDERCAYLISCLAGGWHFPAAEKKAKPGHPEKDNYFEHGGDMTRIAICNVFDEYDVSDKLRPQERSPLLRRRHTGEVVGRISREQILRRRGVHAHHR